MTTVAEAKKSVNVVIKDPQGNVRKVINTGDFQVGFQGNEATLILTGGLEITSRVVRLNPVNPSFTLSSEEIVVCVSAPIVQTTIYLPKIPNKGKMYIVKDVAGTAQQYPIQVVGASGVLIDNQMAGITINDNYGSFIIIYNGEQWVTIARGGTGGIFAPSSASYITVNSETGLSQERNLDTDSSLVITDNGPNSTIEIKLSDTGVVAGTYNTPQLTVDSQGRITAITTGSAAPGTASYVSINPESALPNERVLTAGSGINISDGGPGGSVTISATVQETGADKGASYVTLNNTSSLPNERALSAGTGLRLTDSGAGSSVTFAINDNIVATTSGSTFQGDVTFQGSVRFDANTRISRTSNDMFFYDGNHVGGVTLTDLLSGSGVGGSGGGGDPGAQYLLLAATSSLANHRKFTLGLGLTGSDIGPGGNYIVNVDDRVVATLSGSIFNGAPKFNAGLSGSLTKLVNGVSYLVAGDYVNITTSSIGQVIISATSGITASLGADAGASYLVMGVTSSLANERALTVGTGVRLTDGGAGGNATLSINDGIVATVSGTTFTGVTKFNAGLSGTLSKLTNGLSYLAAGSGIDILTASNGQVIITSNVTSSLVFANGADPDASYIVIASTSSLPNERTLTAGTGIVLFDSGSNNGVILGIKDNVVATLSGSSFFGPVKFNAGLTGSLTQLPSGQPAFAAGQNVVISTGSNGQVIISSFASGSAGSGADQEASYVVLTSTSSLPNERVLTAGTGVKLLDGGVGSSVTLSVNDNIVATLSGSSFYGPVKSTGGFTGSHSTLSSGISFIAGGTGIQVVTASNGQIIINSLDICSANSDPSASYLVVGVTSSLANERALTAGSGITFTDAGVGSTFTVAVSSTVARTTGTTFTGPTIFSGGATGSIQQVSAGLSYIVAGDNITVTSQSNGQVVIKANLAGVGGAGADAFASYVVMATTASLDNERALAAGSGLRLTDGGAGGNVTLAINDNVVASITGSRFTGPVEALAGFTGSLSKLATGLSYIVAGANTTVTSQSNGQIVISNRQFVTGTWRDLINSFVTTGSVSIDSQNRSVSQIGTDVFFYVSGSIGGVGVDKKTSVFGGDVYVSGSGIFETGVQGSVQKLPSGLSYLVAGDFIKISSQSNGQVVISSEATISGTIPTGPSGPNGWNDLGNVLQTTSSLLITGSVTSISGFTGSMTTLFDGSPFLVAGDNVTILSQSNGSIIIHASGSGGAGFTTGSAIRRMESIPLFIGTKQSAQDVDSKDSLGMNYFDPSKLNTSIGSVKYFFRGIFAPNNTSLGVAHLDMYDYSGIILGYPSQISGSTITNYSQSLGQYEADVSDAFLLVTGSGILEARMWVDGLGNQSVVKNARLDIEWT